MKEPCMCILYLGYLQIDVRGFYVGETVLKVIPSSSKIPEYEKLCSKDKHIFISSVETPLAPIIKVVHYTKRIHMIIYNNDTSPQPMACEATPISSKLQYANGYPS